MDLRNCERKFLIISGGRLYRNFQNLEYKKMCAHRPEFIKIFVEIFGAEAIFCLWKFELVKGVMSSFQKIFENLNMNSESFAF